MRSMLLVVALIGAAPTGCSRSGAASNPNSDVAALPAVAQKIKASDPNERPVQQGAVAGGYRGFDRNGYPGDEAMKLLRAGDSAFAFTGFWLTNPPGATSNNWKGKRELLRAQGWGFLALANGRLDAEILRSAKQGVSAAALGKMDAAVAIANARSEGFPLKTIIFLDQEEGGRLLPEQAAYLLAWTEAVAASNYKPGVYASGQLVEDDPGVMIDTIRDIRDRISKGHLHEVAMFDAQDACPPAPGCTVNARPMHEAGEPDLVAWQYSQSPRRPPITKACAATYAADGNCYAPSSPAVFLDMDLATTADPSHGR